MFHPYKIEERPSVIPDVINYINKLCRSEMLDLIEKISADYDIDTMDLMSLYKDDFLKLHLGGNVHYPPPQDVRCKARIRGKGFGKCQCKRRAKENGLCSRHNNQLQRCKEAGCTRGVNGLGACCGHKGLSLGFINKPIPRENDDGEVIIKWKREITYKPRTSKKIKRIKKYKIKKLTKPISAVEENAVDKPVKPKLTKTYLKNEVETLMNNMDLDDGSITTEIIIKQLQLVIGCDLSSYITILEDCIYTCFEKIIADELEDSEDVKPVYDEDLVETFYDEKKYLLHKKSSELFDVHKKIVGHWTGEEPTFY